MIVQAFQVARLNSDLTDFGFAVPHIHSEPPLTGIGVGVEAERPVTGFPHSHHFQFQGLHLVPLTPADSLGVVLVGGPVECPSCYVWSEKGQTVEDEVAESGRVVNPCGTGKFGTFASLEVFVYRVVLMNL